jgi:hypothetical protein
MPASRKQQATTPDYPTRQQLDDLDALMQRMLALPVNPEDDPTEKPPLQGAASENAFGSSPSHLRPPSNTAASCLTFAPGQDCAPDRIGSSGPESSPINAPEENVAETETGAAELFRDTYLSRDDCSRNSLVAMASPLPRQVVIAWWLLPLYWSNRVFDGCAGWLGPLGRWLRGDYGRAVIGGAGFVLLAVVLAWIALDVLGLDLVNRFR